MKDRFRTKIISLLLGLGIVCSGGFPVLAFGEQMRLEEMMKGTAAGILKAKGTGSFLRDREKLFKKTGIVGRNSRMLMAGFDFDAQGQSTTRVYAYLFSDAQKPAYYCLVIDNFAETPLEMDIAHDEYLFKGRDNTYSAPQVVRKNYVSGPLESQRTMFVDLGFDALAAGDMEAFLARINHKKTFLYLIKLPK